MAGYALVTDHIFDNLDVERSELDPLGVELVVAPDTSEQTLVDLARGASAILVCFAPTGKRVVEAAAEGGCRILARYGIGYDNIDVATAQKLGITVTYVPDYCLDEVADHTIALLLASARDVTQASEGVRSGEWKVPHGRVHRLKGCRLALVGAGAIGEQVARRAAAFGLEVVAYDPYRTHWEDVPMQPTATLSEALADADFVSLHAPLSDETHHLINSETIEQMRRTPVLINTSRGGLVDTEAVIHALNEENLSSVALDVTEVEPLPSEHPLCSHPRALVTPHMSFYSVEAQAELQRRTVNEVVRALRGEPPISPVILP